MTNNMFYARLLNHVCVCVCVCVCVLLHEYDYIGTIGCNWGCLNVIPIKGEGIQCSELPSLTARDCVS